MRRRSENRVKILEDMGNRKIDVYKVEGESLEKGSELKDFY